MLPYAPLQRIPSDGAPLNCVPDPYYTCGPTADPYWNEVVLMLHCDGTDASTTLVDSSATGVVPTVTGAAQLSTANLKFGTANALFSGSDNYFSAADAALALGAGDFTIEFWIRLTSVSGTQLGILGNATGSPYWFIVKNANNTLGFRPNGTSTPNTDTSTPLTAGVWYHVAVVKKGGFYRLYLDGIQQLATTVADSTNYTAPTTLRIGWVSAGANTVDGRLDDIRITKGIARYTGNFNIPAAAFPDALETVYSPAAPRTVLALHLDETPPVDVSCAQTKTVALTGSASIAASPVRFDAGALLVPNVGTSTANGLTVASHQDFQFGAGDFTVQCQAYRNANTYQGYLLWIVGPSGAISLRVTTGGLITLVYHSSGGTQTRTTTASFPLAQWNHVALQRRGLNFELWLNGALADTLAVTGGAGSTVDVSGIIYFGRTNASSAESWNGSIDEARITRGVARYTATFTPPALAWCEGGGEDLTPIPAPAPPTSYTAFTALLPRRIRLTSSSSGLLFAEFVTFHLDGRLTLGGSFGMPATVSAWATPPVINGALALEFLILEGNMGSAPPVGWTQFTARFSLQAPARANVVNAVGTLLRFQVRVISTPATTAEYTITYFALG